MDGRSWRSDVGLSAGVDVRDVGDLWDRVCCVQDWFVGGVGERLCDALATLGSGCVCGVL